MKYIIQILPSLLNGTRITILLFAITLVLSIPLGILFALGLRSKFKPLAIVLDLYVWLMRGTPLLLQLIFVFYGLPIIGIVFERFTAGVVAFVFNYAAYLRKSFAVGYRLSVTNSAKQLLYLVYHVGKP